MPAKTTTTVPARTNKPKDEDYGASKDKNDCAGKDDLSKDEGAHQEFGDKLES